ncbi:MAG TPA: tRNA pseudouridine(55) synthase TruB [Bacteroidales bacterium]|nr:tRNA pseudouridine(55) synthase TruB [Bacteroidales bacterium]
MAFDFETGEIILVNKPYRWTSFDVIGALRSFFKKELAMPKVKIGHAGTLDPLATGLMILCTGKATKRIEEFMGLEKEYTGTFVLGASTASFDLEKPVDQVFPTEHITDGMIADVVSSLTGDIMQVPPIFSAIKINGKRAYKSARKGADLELQPRSVNVREFEITRLAMPEVDFRIVCSKGTYIRALARDFGQALGSGAYLSALCRTRIGPYRLADAYEIEQFKELLRKEAGSDVNG